MAKQIVKETVFFKSNCKPFTAYGTGMWDVSVSPEGVVRVHDRIAGYYTTVHALSAAAQRRIRREAKMIDRAYLRTGG